MFLTLYWLYFNSLATFFYGMQLIYSLSSMIIVKKRVPLRYGIVECLI